MLAQLLKLGKHSEAQGTLSSRTREGSAAADSSCRTWANRRIFSLQLHLTLLKFYYSAAPELRTACA
eukprot:COSAG06_NODE_67732_length_251_cov_0.677632_1_plen_66_part_01